MNNWIDFCKISHRVSVDHVDFDVAADHFYYCILIMQKVKGPDFDFALLRDVQSQVKTLK